MAQKAHINTHTELI